MVSRCTLRMKVLPMLASLLVWIPLCTARRRIPSVFFFGDSLLDTGNFGILDSEEPLNFPPYGSTFFGKPSGRYSDGRIITDFIMGKIGRSIKPILSTEGGEERFVHGANFAIGGARVVPLTTGQKKLGLDVQLMLFKQLLANASLAPSDKSIAEGVYILVVGTLDAIQYVTNPELQAQYNITQFASLYVSNLESFIKELHSLGARKFVVSTVLPVDCAPLIKAAIGWTSSPCIPIVGQGVEIVNDALMSKVGMLRALLANVTISLFKPKKSRKLFSNPKKYGLVEGQTACCGGGLFGGEIFCTQANYTVCSKPSDYAFFDSVHPTETIHRYLARRLWQGAPHWITPANVRALIRGK